MTPVLAAVSLCAVAGMVDAVAWLKLQHVFVANQTGNTVLLGLALAERDGTAALHHAVPILAFLAGVLAARGFREALARERPRRAAVLAPLLLEIVLLAGTSRLLPASGLWSAGLLSFGIGLQNGALTKFGSLSLNTAVITGTLEKLGETVAHGMARSFSGKMRMDLAKTAGSWAAYCAGAALAALALPVLGAATLFAPALLLLVSLPLLVAESDRG